jgi:hypothetical protein
MQGLCHGDVMNRVLLGFLVAVMGCSSGEIVNEPPMVLVDAGDDGDGGGCVPEVVTKTFFPSVGVGDALILCSICDEGQCDKHGEACFEYGAPCDFYGTPSVCVACCDGETAELHCAKGGA